MTNSSYVTNTLPGQIAMLDEVRYFGITINTNGTLTTSPTDLANIQTIKNIIANLPAGLRRPRLDITLGGAGASGGFSSVAADPVKYEVTAQAINALMTNNGVDAVDLDWEHPAAGVERTTRYPNMLGRIKQVVGADHKVYATVDPTVFINNNVFAAGANAIDGVDLMTYDLGWWGNDPQNPNVGEHSLPEYVTAAVQAWSSPANTQIPASFNYVKDYVYANPWGNNAPLNQLGVGLPFYAHAVSGSDPIEPPSYAALVAGGTTSDGNYYMYQGINEWLPGLGLVDQRIKYAHDNNLQSVFAWELGHDLPTSDPKSMLRRAYAANQRYVGDYNADGVVDMNDYNLWVSTFGLTTGGTNDMRADGNANGIIDSGDYTIWRDNAIVTPGSGGVTTQGVPEPSAIVLTCIGAMSFLALRRVSAP